MNLILKIDILLFVITVLFTGYNLFFPLWPLLSKEKKERQTMLKHKAL